MTNGFSHHYHFGESTFIFRGVRIDFLNFIQFFDEISLSKQNSPRWDAAFFGGTSGAILFACVPKKGCLNELMHARRLNRYAHSTCTQKMNTVLRHH